MIGLDISKCSVCGIEETFELEVENSDSDTVTFNKNDDWLILYHRDKYEIYKQYCPKCRKIVEREYKIKKLKDANGYNKTN